MAIVRGAFGGGQIKGSIAGNTFQQSPYGTVIRNRTVPVNPNTTFQVQVRTGFNSMSDYWQNTLTTPQRIAWNDYAAETPLPDAFGTPVATKGRQMFMRSNVARSYYGLPIIDDAPTTPGVGPNPLLTLAMEAGPSAELSDVGLTLATGDLVLIRLGLAVNVTKNYYKAPFRARAAVGSTTTLPLTILLSNPTVVGQRYFWASRFFGADGKVSFETIQPVDVVP